MGEKGGKAEEEKSNSFINSQWKYKNKNVLKGKNMKKNILIFLCICIHISHIGDDLNLEAQRSVTIFIRLH